MDEEGRPFFDFHEKLYRTVTENGRTEQSALDIFQLSNGNIFYYQYETKPQRLFVKHYDDRGLEIFVDLPSEKINHVGVHGEALYFEANRKIYKATFAFPDPIQLTRVRDLFENERSYYGALLCKTLRNGNQVVYRMCDNPDSDGILVDVPNETLEKHGFSRLYLFGIFNGVAFYTPKQGSKVRRSPLAVKLCASVIMIELPKYGFADNIKCSTYSAASADELPARFYSCDSYAYSYFTNGSDLYAFDIETFSFLEPLRFRHVVWTIAGIHDGVITTRGHRTDNRMTGELPRKYRKGNGLSKAATSTAKSDKQSSNTLTKDDFTDVSMKPMIAERQKNKNKLVADFEKINIGGQQPEFKSNFLVNFVPRKVLGEGGFGCVFEASGILDNRIYAVKRIPINGSGSDREDAIQEVRILASLEHEGIVTYNSSWIESPPKGWQKKTDEALLKKLQQKSTVEYNDDCSFIFIQMELCDHSLADYVYDLKIRYFDLAQYWFYDLVTAVEYLHDKNIIHRDLKPSNILFNLKNMQLKICDFGLVSNRSRVIKNGKEIDVTRTACGTAMYAAPEQFSSSTNAIKYTSKVDIFSLGLILIHLCKFLDLDEAVKLFDLYRENKAINVLYMYPEAAKLVRLMTYVDPSKRINCETILRHPFFTSKTKPVERLLETSTSLRLNSGKK